MSNVCVSAITSCLFNACLVIVTNTVKKCATTKKHTASSRYVLHIYAKFPFKNNYYCNFLFRVRNEYRK